MNALLATAVIISISVLVSAQYEVFKTNEEADAFVEKWCTAYKNSWVDYHDEDKLWAKDDPFWAMHTENLQFCRNADCFDGLKGVIDGYNESGLSKLMIAKNLNCDIIMYHTKSVLLEIIWDLVWNNGNPMVFKEVAMIYLDENGLVSQVHHHHKKEITDQFTENWMQNIPQQKEDL